MVDLICDANGRCRVVEDTTSNVVVNPTFVLNPEERSHFDEVVLGNGAPLNLIRYDATETPTLFVGPELPANVTTDSLLAWHNDAAAPYFGDVQYRVTLTEDGQLIRTSLDAGGSLFLGDEPSWDPALSGSYQFVMGEDGHLHLTYEEPAIITPAMLDQLETQMLAERERIAGILDNAGSFTATSLSPEVVAATHERRRQQELQSDIDYMTSVLSEGVDHNLAENFDILPRSMQASLEGYRDDEQLSFRFELHEVAGAMVPFLFLTRGRGLLGGSNTSMMTGEGVLGGLLRPPNIGRAPIRVWLPEGRSLEGTGGPRNGGGGGGFQPLVGLQQAAGMTAVLMVVDASVIALDIPEEYQGEARAVGTVLGFEGLRRTGLLPFQWAAGLEGMPLFTGMNYGFSYLFDAGGAPIGTPLNTYGSFGASAATYTTVVPWLANNSAGFNTAWHSTRGISTTGELLASSRGSLQPLGRLGQLLGTEGWAWASSTSATISWANAGASAGGAGYLTGINGSLGTRVLGGSLQAASAFFAVMLGDMFGGVLVDWAANDGSPEYRLMKAAFDSLVQEDGCVVGGIFPSLTQGIWTIVAEPVSWFADENPLYGPNGGIAMREREWVDAARNFAVNTENNLVSLALSSIDYNAQPLTFNYEAFEGALQRYMSSLSSDEQDNLYALMKLTKHRDSHINNIYHALDRDGEIDQEDRLNRTLYDNATAQLRTATQARENRLIELGLAYREGSELRMIEFRSADELNPSQYAFLFGDGTNEPTENIVLGSRQLALQSIVDGVQARFNDAVAGPRAEYETVAEELYADILNRRTECTWEPVTIRLNISGTGSFQSYDIIGAGDRESALRAHIDLSRSYYGDLWNVDDFPRSLDGNSYTVEFTINDEY